MCSSSSCQCCCALCSTKRARLAISLLASSNSSCSWLRNTSGLCGTTIPNSASRPRMRLISAVRSSLMPSRRRCTLSMPCCSTVLGDEVHVGTRGSFAHGCRVVGVVLAAVALDAIGGNELRRDHAGIKAQRLQLVAPVVCTRAGLHRNQTTCGQLDAPGYEFFPPEGPCHHHCAVLIDRVNLDDILCQVNTNSDNLAHGTSPSNMGLSLTVTSSKLGTLIPLPGSGKSLLIQLTAL